MRLNKSSLILLVIVILGGVLRLYNLDKVSMYGDELTIALDSYSLLKNGTDQLGNPWPVTFEMGAGRPLGYVYGSIPFIALFGPTYLGVRMLSILSGLGLIILIYLLSRRLISEKTALVAAFLTAISPWGINLSRGGFEANFALFLLMLGTVLIIYLEKQRWYLLLTSLCFGLVVHTYPTYKLTLPLFFIIILWFTGTVKWILSQKQRLVTGISVIVLSITIITSVQQTIWNNSEGRFGEINIFSNKEISEFVTQKINLERDISQLPQSIKPLLVNRYLEYSSLYIENYLKNLSIDFLFLHGDGNPRHNMSVSGGFYLVELAFILLGVLTLLNKNKTLLLFLTTWVLITPLAAALIGNPHFLRNSMMLPPIIIISAIGLSNLKGKVRLALVGMLIFQFLMLLSRLYFLAPSEFGRFWSESAKLTVSYIEKNKDQYRYIFVSDRIDNIEYAYPVYANIDPNLVIGQNKFKISFGEKQFKKFGDVYIGSLPISRVEDFIKTFSGKILYIGPAGDASILQGAEILHTSNNDPALVIKKYEK